MELKSIEAVESALTSQGRWTAFVEKPALNETQLVLSRALALLGPNGENWFKGSACNDEETAFCAMGAVYLAMGRRAQGVMTTPMGHGGLPCELMHQASVEGYGEYMGIVNDKRGTPFAAIRSVFLRAIELAGTTSQS